MRELGTDGAANIIERVLVSDFDYPLPAELIAQQPLDDRAASRMLLLNRASGEWEDRKFRELSQLLRPSDLVVLNNTRVFPARLFGRRAGANAQRVSPRNPAAKEFLHGQVEVLLTQQHSAKEDRESQVWDALVRPGRKIGIGERLFFGERPLLGEAQTKLEAAEAELKDSASELEAEVIARGEFGERTLRFQPVPDFFERIERLGHVPLPPYIDRPDSPADRERYQTVFADTGARGSVAAPTAGLHFTREILDEIRARGIETAEITLHVGLGTFQPVHLKNVEEHAAKMKMHRERYSISEKAAAQINKALREQRRIVAIGTTTVRTLEHAALNCTTSSDAVNAGAAEADLFIYPGFQFRVVRALLTNFHLPQSTLLMLVSAFAGREHILAAYRHAVEQRYRFFSYGDCMFIE